MISSLSKWYRYISIFYIVYVNKYFCTTDEILEMDMYNTNSDETGELLFVKLKSKIFGRDLIVGNTYKSPSIKPDAYIDKLQATLEAINANNKNKTSVLCGDTNIDLIKHDQSPAAVKLIETIMSNGYLPIISRPTRITDHSATLIDHIYTNSLDCLVSTGVIPLDISDHMAIYVKLNTKFSYLQNVEQTDPTEEQENHSEYRKFNDDNLKKFEELISIEPWDELIDESREQHLDTEQFYKKFLDRYQEIYDEVFPTKVSNQEKRKNQRKNSKPWILPWLEDACARKNRLFFEYIKSPTPENKCIYEKMKKFVKKHIKKAKAAYYKKYFEQYKHDSKKQWQMINKVLKRGQKKINITKLIRPDGTEIKDQNAIADEFNEYFCNIAENIKSKSTSTPNQKTYGDFLGSPIPETIYLETVDGSEVEEIIKNLKNKTTSDTKMSALKVASKNFMFTRVIAEIINNSFKDGKFPSPLKLAKVVPIHKNGKKCDVTNYRPISLLSSFSKIFEKVMHKRITAFLNDNNSIFDNQYGFRNGHSC